MKYLHLMLLALIPLVGISQNPVTIPPTLSGTNINLNLETGTVNYFSGPLTNTYGINGNILGPTLILEKDSFVNFNVTNNLPDTTTIHWHGLHVAAENDGGPHTIILPTNTWNPSFTVKDKAATYWYHPHLHRKTNEHVERGMAGFIIVKDAEEAALTLPRTYGVDDFPLVFQTKAFDASNQIIVRSHEDTTMLVNGTIDPYLDVPGQVVRLRLLNGSSKRTYVYGFSNNMNFSQIASDGGLLAAPIDTNRILLSPGERAEILVDFSTLIGQTIDWVSYGTDVPITIYGSIQPSQNGFHTLPGYAPNPFNGKDKNILQINVQPATTSPVTTIPLTLATVTPWLEANANATRTISMGTGNPGPNVLQGPFYLDGGSFDMNVINHTIPLNNIEVWTLNNNTPTSHPFHIHDVQFYILDRDGNTPPLNEQGRKDVVLVKAQETVRFIAKFDDFANDTIPYMYHCHMLTHEDDGMMGQFVVSSTINVEEINESINELLYPNPTENYIKLNELNQFEYALIYNANGKLVKRIAKPEGLINVQNFSAGFYFLQLQGKGTDIKTYKFLKK
jgi:bilirubin oxidase